jgi:sugar phosphate isomerase/epimerase
MNASLLTRRQFVRNTAIALGVASASRGFGAAPAAASSPWTIGCLNRPWVKWSADEMLDGVKAAGYGVVGLQTPTAADPFVGSTAKPEYLAALRQKIGARGLTATMSRLRTMDTAAFPEATADIRKQVDNARALGLGTLINTGTTKAELYKPWYRLMAFAAAYSSDHGIRLVTKPHGGVNASAQELLACLEQINHPNLGIWYDAGNVIHYTGKDPIADWSRFISRVTRSRPRTARRRGVK